MSDLLQRVYRTFDPAPLENDDLYVDLDSVRGGAEVVSRLATRIQLSDDKTCQLLAGHRGSGKSTELRRLMRRLEAQGTFVVFCESDQDIDRNDVDFPDVLVAIVRQLGAQLQDRAKIALSPGYFRGRWEELKSLLGSEVSFESLELAAGMAKVSGAIRGSPNARAAIRKLLEPDTTNLLAAVNDIIGEAKLKLREKGYKSLAIFVDDLDKMVLREQRPATNEGHLFISREAQLTAFECHMIYTVPLALAYSAQARTVATLYGGNIPVVPMTKIATPPPDSRPFAPGVQKFQDVISKRLDRAGAKHSDVFGEDHARDELIRLSGGQPRELMILIREALVSGGLPIQNVAVDRARVEVRRAYSRVLRKDHWDLIERFRTGEQVQRTVDNDGVLRELLDARALLQYVNDEEWCGVNPLVGEPPEQQPRGAS